MALRKLSGRLDVRGGPLGAGICKVRLLRRTPSLVLGLARLSLSERGGLGGAGSSKSNVMPNGLVIREDGDGNEGACEAAAEAVKMVGASAAICVLLRFLNMTPRAAEVVIPRMSSPELETPCAQDPRPAHFQGMSRDRLVVDVCDHDPETLSFCTKSFAAKVPSTISSKRGRTVSLAM
jgi:hypothetical protein